MKWNKYTILTTTAAEDVISAMLGELGIEGVEIENHVPLTEQETGGMFIDFPLELPPDDGTSKVSFYLDAGADDLGDVGRGVDGQAGVCSAGGRKTVFGYWFGYDYKGTDRRCRLDEQLEAVFSVFYDWQYFN